MPQIFVQAVLFDLDGTLVDSSGSVERNWQKLAARIGMPWDDIKGWIHGIPVRQVMRTLRPDLDDDEVEELHQFMTVAESTDTGDVVPMPGALAALDVLPTTRWAIVTSGGQRLASARIKAAGLPIPRFLVTADDVKIGKPAPDPYLAGARLVGHAPDHCLAVEDAPPGLASARAAGAQVLGIASTHAVLDAPTVTSLAEVEFSPDRAGIAVTW